MHELLWITALVAGLLGSTHCLGMCGGIVMSLNASLPRGAARHWLPLAYNLGRIGSYVLAGALAGALGAAGGVTFLGSHGAESLRLGAAAIMVLVGAHIALGAARAPSWMNGPERLGAWLWRCLSSRIVPHLPRAGLPRALAVGLVWGWLPCGMVYTALLAAATAGDALSGSLTMLAFGAGTLPAMAGIAYIGAYLRAPAPACTRLVGACVIAGGLWTAVLPLGHLAGIGHHHMNMVTTYGQ